MAAYVLAIVIAYVVIPYTSASGQTFPATLLEVVYIPAAEYSVVFLLYLLWYLAMNLIHFCKGSTEYLTPVVQSSKPQILNLMMENMKLRK